MKRIIIFVFLFFILIISQAKEKEIKSSGIKENLTSDIISPGEEIEKKFITDIYEKIALTDLQKEKIKKIYNNFRKEIIKQKAQIEILKIELEEFIFSGEPDFEFIKIKAKEINRMNENIMMMRLKVIEDIYEILTIEQKNSLISTQIPDNQKEKLNKKGK